MTDIAGVILAAGMGKRMNSSLPKVLHPLCGKPMILYIIDALKKAGISRIVSVVGHEKELIQKTIGTQTLFAVQKQQRGTADALKQALPVIQNEFPNISHIILCCGDTPLLKPSLFSELIHTHTENSTAVTVVTMNLNDPHGYGRIVKDPNNNIRAIVEQKDCSEDQQRITEVNSGVYMFDLAHLLHCIEHIESNNAQNEYYLTDTVSLFYDQGLKTCTYCVADAMSVTGINNRCNLSELEEYMRAEIIEKHMLNGVTIQNAHTVYIDDSVTIGQDTVIKGPCYIEQHSNIGAQCSIGPFTYIKHSSVEDNATLFSCSIIDNVHIS